MPTCEIIEGECLQALQTLPDASFQLIYIDPPFNTGQLRVSPGESGASYEDSFDDLPSYLEPRLREALRLLTPTGSLFVHLDPREVHYVKVLLDQIFSRASFKNEIIWSYDFGGRSKERWPAKHDNILWYTRDPARYTYHFDQVERIPYMAPGWVSQEKQEAGKTLTDVWWHTIVPTAGAERARGENYPTMKPVGLLNRIVRVHSNLGDTVLDFFAGSGTTGEAALSNDRNCVLVDQNPQAVATMRRRLAGLQGSVLEMFAIR